MLERGNPLINLIQDKGSSLDHRIIYNSHKYESMADLYSLADCVVLPSRSEGWGMPHREAAMMGLPVITQKYAGTDDGHTEEWAIVLPEGRMEPIPKNGRTGGSGNWMIADTRRLAEEMYECYENPERVSVEGLKAREWLSNNQTWMHSAAGLIELVHDQIGWDYGIAMESSSRRSLAESGRAVYEGCRFVG
jgi:glycosyltransferase involved in cell wall biosynthesis